MKKLFLFFVLLLMIAVSNSHAGDSRIIELLDGSVIHGEVINIREGIYTLKSESLGIIRVEESKIRTIRFRGSLDPAASGSQGNKVQPAELPESIQKPPSWLPILILAFAALVILLLMRKRRIGGTN